MSDSSLVGGKGASLGELTRAGIPVPPGFIVTTDVFRKFAYDSVDEALRAEILSAFDKLGAERVAVRSSAVAEDSSSASWAGQLETYLNVTREDLINRIKDCCNSIKSKGALAYAEDKNVSEDQLAVAVVVQKMIDSEVSGVVFTVNPITKDENELMIEAGFGLGEMMVQGMITPDSFVVDKKTLEIKNSDIKTQETMMIFKNGETKEVEVPDDKKSEQALDDDQVIELAKLALKIENHYGSPQDIEWALEKENIYILQSRPITTL
ncbi:MAG: PEP/pyruvate-binding domain-containing protein [Candidatus Colwellbacteria bacterium]|nr:PEP/pyruvate-binding domain-containing protein [Candidatus Colwellbacteria bacterium]